MTSLTRGIQLYLVMLAFVATLTIVWGANGVLLNNTTEGTGWPLLIGVSGAAVGLGVLLQYRRTTEDGDATSAPYPWSSENRP